MGARWALLGAVWLFGCTALLPGTDRRAPPDADASQDALEGSPPGDAPDAMDAMDAQDDTTAADTSTADSAAQDTVLVDTAATDTAPEVGCRSNMDCVGMAVCDLMTGRCAGCRSDLDCGAREACCGGQCLDTLGDVRNCGACGRACAAGEACCGGACAATMTDARNCGGCGNVCNGVNGTASCAGGRCGIMACNAGFGDCDADPANGCETATSADPANCGRCGSRCAAGANQMVTCAAGVCAPTCNAGFGDCDRSAANGCEVDTRATAAHCGGCGVACPAGANATAACVSSTCQARCNAGVGDCDGSAAHGCETALGGDARHCGGCGVLCGFPRASGVCAGGACGLGLCSVGFGNCDGNSANGCERDLSADNANCGLCGRACAAGQVCSGGVCGTVCMAGQTLCGGRCVDPVTDPAHCGRCGNACAFPNATGTCAAGACGLTCTAGFQNCDGMTGNGCEVNIQTDVAHCGRCGNRCPAVNGVATCAAETCGVTCTAPFLNCDGSSVNGCEVNPQTDAAHCGGCGMVCRLANATASCRAGGCVVARCDAGFDDCNASAADGCEANLNTSESHCGRCNNRCSLLSVCSGGACTGRCLRPLTLCGSSCVDINTDEAHCGGCGRACVRGQVCTSGVCGAAPPANDTCTGAADIPLTASRVTLSATTVGATHSLDAPCFAAGLGDVFYRFTLTAREYVYADTFTSPGFTTKLFFLSSCTAALTSRTPGDNVCDATGGLSCAGPGSQVFTVLPAGTYYLVLQVSSGSAGSATINFQHLPAGAGDTTQLLPGSTAPSGATSGSSGSSTTCGGSGPEDTFWWVSCTATAAGAFTASTCSRATWNTVLAVRNGTGVGDACNNDAVSPPAPSGCSPQSYLTASLGSGAGLHVLYVDGFGGATGVYGVAVTRP
ncbi:MAG: hypothetical protein HY909_12840 [Deltaproteobacteria bacterium]|nr:hypothetical protein [Deltaproteobacteria bacterium]